MVIVGVPPFEASSADCLVTDKKKFVILVDSLASFNDVKDVTAGIVCQSMLYVSEIQCEI